MNILINASNLKTGGAIQVTDSICLNLINYPQHQFTIVLSSHFKLLAEKLPSCPHITVQTHDIRNSLETLILGRDLYLDNLIIDNAIDIVITIFGPSRWNPRCLHLSGFAMPHLVLADSLYFTRQSKLMQLKHKLRNKFLKYYFKRSTKFFYTENPFISELVSKLFNIKNIYTVTNYYNQIFDNEQFWKEHPLPVFGGFTILTISSWYEHKNLPIIITVAQELKRINPNLKFRFVITVSEKEFPTIPNEVRTNILLIGKVAIEECPSLYRQSNCMFLPTLLECFSASYAEAMRMGVPIVTTDLTFAHGLCGNAALYYSPLSGKDAAEKINILINNKAIKDELALKAKKQLTQFDDYNTRTQKIIKIAEEIVNSNSKR